MADIRCPMCSKFNPADSEVCQYCQARLKPVWLGQGAPPQADDTNIFGGSNAAGAGDLPDWLSGIRQPDDAGSTPADAAPDWLSGIRQPDEPSSPAASGRGADDWLGSIMGDSDTFRDDSAALEDSAGSTAAFGASSGDDWLSRIGGSDDAAVSPATPADELPDWLSGGASTGAAASDNEFEHQDFAASGDELPDWLSGGAFGASASPAAADKSGAQDFGASSGDDLPDWLSSTPAGGIFGDDKPAAQDFSASSGDDLPDWLSGAPVAGAFADDKPAAQDFSASSGNDLPDWLSGAPAAGAFADDKPAAQDFSADSGDDLPDWLSGAPAAGAFADDDAGKQDFGASAGDEIPDWLSGAPAAGTFADDKPGAQDFSADSGDDLPDWLSGAPAAGAFADDDAAKQDFGASAGDEIPDWLAGAPTGAAAAFGAVPDFSQTAADDTEDDFSWLTDATSASPAAPAAASTGRPPAGDAIPDWLASEGEAASSDSSADWMNAGAVPVVNPSPEAMDVPEWLSAEAPVSSGDSGGAQAGDIPDWMRGALSTESGSPQWLDDDNLDWLESETQEAQDAAQASAAGYTPAATPAFTSGALEGDLSWLSDSSDAFTIDDAATPMAGLGAGAFADLGAPDWADAEPQAPAASAPAASSPRSEADLRPSDLPDWLQAMRPMGSTGMAASEDSEGVSGAGPLAGLRGVLPAEAEIGQTGKPPLYSMRLEFSDSQRTRAELLASQIEADGQPQPVPSAPVITTQGVLRMAMAFLLILPVLLSVVTGFPLTAAPPSSGVMAPLNLVNGLAPAAPVLLAVDYEPALSGEMDALTAALLEHLVEKKAYVSFVSTVPTGPLQAEHLVTLARRHKNLLLSAPADYTNLGFIPGGSAGLQAFAGQPARVMPQALDGSAVWTQGPLAGFTSLSQFSLVIVAVDNPDTARYWIEQVQPQLGGVPLIMLTSAQAEPFVRPYQAASRTPIQGLVSGLRGAVAYERVAVQSGVATQYWPAFNIGLLVAALLMLLGMVFNLVSTGILRRRELAAKEGKQ